MESKHGPRSQRGMALMLMVLLVAVGTAALLFGRIGSGGTAIAAKDDRTRAALALAKDALIARASAHPSHAGLIIGTLPCTDRITNDPTPPFVNVPDDGIADSLAGPDCAGDKYVGRLPWKTLGLSDLRDGSGERLWYALSKTYRDSSAVRPIHDGISGELVANGANDVVAVILAPGPPLPGQASRPSSNPLDYLEGENADEDDDYVQLAASATFNDRIMVITRAELMRAVEKRIVGEVRGSRDPELGLLGYFDKHGRFPWAADPDVGDQISPVVSGSVPWNDADANFVDPETKQSLLDNDWFQRVQYTVVNPLNEARLLVGCTRVTVRPSVPAEFASVC